ncbi:MAG: tyrosine-type recombinase/integrase [Acidimicrobiales bacterium]
MRRERPRSPWAATTDALWLSAKGPLTASGIAQMLRRRAARADIPHLHSHMFRHTFAHTWLAEGGNEGDLMRLAGWRSRVHADIIRELLDGAAGLREGNDNMSPVDQSGWEAHRRRVEQAAQEAGP